MRYTETAVRRALRYRRRHAEDGQPELLAKVLPADESYDPPHALADDPSPSDTAPDAQLSQASAWLFLVGRSGNEVQRLAAGLLISESHGYHAWHARAAWHADSIRWPSAARTATGCHCNRRVGGRFRYERHPIQLHFTFVTEPTLWQENAAGPG